MASNLPHPSVTALAPRWAKVSAAGVNDFARFRNYTVCVLVFRVGGGVVFLLCPCGRTIVNRPEVSL